MKPSEYIAYFKRIAEKNAAIRHDDATNKCFARGSIDEFLDNVYEFTGNGPFMFLEYKTGRLGDAGDNPFDFTRGAFMILIKVNTLDHDDEAVKLDEAFAIGTDILKRIWHTSRGYVEGETTPFDNFQLNSVLYQRVGAKADNEKGYRFEFDLPEGMDFTYDATKWID